MPAPDLLLIAAWLLTAAPQIPTPTAEASRSVELRNHRDEILGRERSKLSGLAERLRREGRAAEAGEVEPGSAEAPAADGSSKFVPLPEVVLAAPKEPGEAEAGWRVERESIRSEAARDLFDLAGQAAKPPAASLALADECLRAVLARQPDHPEARRLLGFLPHEGGWATPYAIERLAKGYVSDPTYGWVQGDWIPHLRRGELPGPPGSNRWLPATEADALRRDWAKHWEIYTEHFRISTNVPLNEAISFGRKLEHLHELFFALMADVIGPDRLPLALRFKNPKLKPSASKNVYKVDYFATREEYARFLAPVQGADAWTNLGTYLSRKDSRELGGVSYFFNDVGGQLDVAATLFHEASHQLLFESAGPSDYEKNRGHVWVFEGLGTYFETLQGQPDGSFRVGGMAGPRIAQARKRLVEGKEFIPIERLIAITPARFWAKPQVYLNYVESMAVAVFLMQADGGRHREGFLDYVRDAYRGRFREGSGRPLDERVGLSYPEMNRAFLRYLAEKSRP